MFNQLKTAMLLGLLGGVLLLIGGLLGGQQGLIIALFFAIVMNFGAYWYSDKVVLRIYRARELDVTEHAHVHRLLNQLSKKAKLPKPKLYLIPSQNPNAFATGRNPSNAAIGVTVGILNLLNDKELKGVLAHELSHIKNRDILVGSVAATIATNNAARRSTTPQFLALRRHLSRARTASPRPPRTNESKSMSKSTLISWSRGAGQAV